ncbi:hypothetical protein FIU97_10945 [Roseivivax sp. THAF40]|uniref:hypothetical protein n=1 Tax=unclassified Roseivivax TaxID=2639302 RepID=UPI001268701F|nr:MULTISPECIES: hypothetical protein [unclassified Roseivivax]QFS83346.1 hypothetical protein FIV09_10960 [Roseivivax sp. THAF197b]QFT47090.1 hypothetical protein FIU97_10945 [Roseivivax sp. THAF40]
MTAMPERPRSIRASLLRWCPSLLTAARILFALLLSGIIAFWLYFAFCLGRTIVVDAETGALEITLEAEMSGKTFREVWICEKPKDGDDDEVLESKSPTPPKPMGCPSRTHHIIGPEISSTRVLPAGAELKISSLPGVVRIDVVSLPDRYKGSDVARLEGGALVLMGQEVLETFGTLPLSGKLKIGAGFSETDRLSVASGGYQIRGYTPTGWVRGDMRQLRGGALLGGALLRFVDRKGDTATGHLAIMLADPDTSLMRVTAISDHGVNDLEVRYFGASFDDIIIIRPSFFEAVILDPTFQLVVTILGAIAGFGWLRRLLTIRRNDQTL